MLLQQLPRRALRSCEQILSLAASTSVVAHPRHPAPLLWLAGCARQAAGLWHAAPALLLAAEPPAQQHFDALRGVASAFLWLKLQADCSFTW